MSGGPPRARRRRAGLKIVASGNEETTMHQMSAEMRSCIDECLRCYQTCLGTAMTHCLEQGGKHVEPNHFRLMMACTEICRTSAHFMLIGTPHHTSTPVASARRSARSAPAPASRSARCRNASMPAAAASRVAAGWQPELAPCTLRADLGGEAKWGDRSG